jgi:hypothetical protein
MMLSSYSKKTMQRRKEIYVTGLIEEIKEIVGAGLRPAHW